MGVGYLIFADFDTTKTMLIDTDRLFFRLNLGPPSW